MVKKIEAQGKKWFSYKKKGVPQKPLQSLYYLHLTYLPANYSYNCMKIIIIKQISISSCHFEER